MSAYEKAKQDYDGALRQLAELHVSMQEKEQYNSVEYERWVMARLRLWIARERLRQAKSEAP